MYRNQPDNLEELKKPFVHKKLNPQQGPMQIVECIKGREEESILVMLW